MWLPLGKVSLDLAMLWEKRMWTQLPALTRTSCVNLSESFKLSEPQVPNLWRGMAKLLHRA